MIWRGLAVVADPWSRHYGYVRGDMGGLCDGDSESYFCQLLLVTKLLTLLGRKLTFSI